METQLHVVLVFELMEGGDLLNYLSKKGPTAAAAALSEDEARLLFHQVFGLLLLCQRGLHHYKIPVVSQPHFLL